MPPPRTKPLAHQLPQLDIRHLHRERVLGPYTFLTLAWPRLGRSCSILVLRNALEVTREGSDSETIELIWRNGTLGGCYPSLRCPN